MQGTSLSHNRPAAVELWPICGRFIAVSGVIVPFEAKGPSSARWMAQEVGLLLSLGLSILAPGRVGGNSGYGQLEKLFMTTWGRCRTVEERLVTDGGPQLGLQPASVTIGRDMTSQGPLKAKMVNTFVHFLTLCFV